MNKTRSKISKFFTYFATILFALTLLYFLAAGIIYMNVYLSAKNIPQYHFNEYVRVMIYGSSELENENKTISANFSIIDSNGNEIAWFERSWNGSYLSVEFSEINLAGKYYIFPTKIYGKDRILDNKVRGHKYTDLEKYYNENGVCILLGAGVPENDRKDLFYLSKFATGKLPVYNFGKTHVFSVDLSGCENGRYYSIHLNSRGGIEIEEL